MHKNAMDVCVRILKSFAVSNNRYKVRVDWINLGYSGQPWDLGERQTVDIRKPQEWLDITHDLHKVRTRPGFP